LDPQFPLPLASVCRICSSPYLLLAQIQTLIHSEPRILYILTCSSSCIPDYSTTTTTRSTDLCFKKKKCSSDPNG
jgi:hypothetical protein